jgi:chemotaxis response regulator CheB
MSSLEVLIVDDQARFRRMVRSLIEPQPGYRVCGEAGDGIEALEKVHQLLPDLVLLDINMPRTDGLEAARFGLEVLIAMPSLLRKAIRRLLVTKPAASTQTAS